METTTPDTAEEVQDRAPDVRDWFRIPEYRLAGLEDKIAKLSHRGAKLGCEPITVEIIAAEDVPHKDGRVDRFVYIRVHGEAPRLNGWAFLATLEHLGEENIIRARLGSEGRIPERFRTAAPGCEQCHTARNRIDTYLVEHEDGRIAQVGRNCLADFIGGQNPENVALMHEYLLTAEEAAGECEEWGGGGGCGGGIEYFDHGLFLSFVAAAMRNDGWMSRTKAAEGMKAATADVALSAMFPPRGKTTAEEYMPTDVDRAKATACLDWTRAELERKATTFGETISDYEWNLKVVASRDVLRWKQAGLAASIVPFYERAMGREVIRRREATVSAWQGEVGKREVWILTVSAVIGIDGDWGMTYLTKMIDDAGNVFVWFASESAASMDVGDTYEVKGTVKKHDERNGVKQTVLTRCKPKKVTMPPAKTA